MDGLLKVLIATACSVVIIGGGYYASTEYRSYQQGKEVADRIDRARKELFGFAEAAEGETDKVRDFCRTYNKALDPSRRGSDVAVRNCRALGYLY
ncbi:hypothetical protein [Mycoplana ramosa]